MRRMHLPAVGLVSVLLVGGCSKSPEDDGRSRDESTSQAGEMIFETRCFVCHGRAGKGDGPASTGLGAAVRDLTNPSWQNSTSDETLRTVIRSGARAVGGSPAMPPNPDLSDDQIRSLLKFIRGLR
jgi:mono/diheme cytochrome c family protein